MKRVFLLFIYLSIYFGALAQPKLKVEPAEMEFRDIFQRFQKVYFINDGNEPLYLDSLTYLNSGIYYLRFNNYQHYPILIQPGDSVAMDCILAGYYAVTANDTLDTLFIYNNGVKSLEFVKIKIDFFEPDYKPGSVIGNISDKLLPVSNSRIYFFRDGNYLITQTVTDANGNYIINLPPGNYLIAAEKDSFYTTFFGQSLDPFNASRVSVKKDSVFTANISLTKIPYNTATISVSGNVRDDASDNLLDRAIVVIRKGIHTPSKINLDTLLFRALSAIVQSNGNYEIKGIKDPGYYYPQAFSNFYIPGYFRSGQSSPFFWQNSDSIHIQNSMSNVNFALTRDSSIGGGSISGVVGNSSNVGEGVTVYAKSVDQNMPFSYAITNDGGAFIVQNLPYGRYQVIAQELGKNDSYSDTITIAPGNTNITGVTLFFTTSVSNDNIEPSLFMLNQNYPNPFNPSTLISFSLNKRDNVSLKIYNLLGQQVALLVEEILNPGNYSFEFNPGNKLSSGVYIFVLRSGSLAASKKMIYLK